VSRADLREEREKNIPPLHVKTTCRLNEKSTLVEEERRIRSFSGERERKEQELRTQGKNIHLGHGLHGVRVMGESSEKKEKSWGTLSQLEGIASATSAEADKMKGRKRRRTSHKACADCQRNKLSQEDLGLTGRGGPPSLIKKRKKDAGFRSDKEWRGGN